MKETPFEPGTLDELRQRAKRQLRQSMRSLRAAYPEAQRAEKSRAVVERISALREFTAARGVALFWPLLDRQELDIRALDLAARAAGKSVYYPCLDEKEDRFETGFGRVSSTAELAERGHRFAEPPPEAPRGRRGEIDLVIVPALALAGSGHRLGYGSGFYDTTLPDFCPPASSVAVAYDFQLLAELPVSEHDVPCDILVTDARVLRVTP